MAWLTSFLLENPHFDLKKLSLEAFKLDPVSSQFIDAIGCNTMPDAFSAIMTMVVDSVAPPS